MFLISLHLFFVIFLFLCLNLSPCFLPPFLPSSFPSFRPFFHSCPNKCAAFWGIFSHITLVYWSSLYLTSVTKTSYFKEAIKVTKDLIERKCKERNNSLYTQMNFILYFWMTTAITYTHFSWSVFFSIPKSWIQSRVIVIGCVNTAVVTSPLTRVNLYCTGDWLCIQATTGHTECDKSLFSLFLPAKYKGTAYWRTKLPFLNCFRLINDCATCSDARVEQSQLSPIWLVLSALAWDAWNGQSFERKCSVLVVMDKCCG